MNEDRNVDFTPLPGRCSALKPQKRKPNRLSLFVDDQFVCGAIAKAFEVCGITVDSRVDETLIRQLLELDERFRFQDQCYRWLGRRAYSRGELVQKGVQKGYPEKIITSVLDEFQENGWIDDRNFACDYADIHFRRKQWGPGKIRAGLAQKGVAKTDIDFALKQLEDFDEQLFIMKNVVGKNRRRLLREPDLQKRKHKLIDLLRRKGYHPEVIFRNIEHLIQHLTDETTNT